MIAHSLLKDHPALSIFENNIFLLGRSLLVIIANQHLYLPNLFKKEQIIIFA